MKGFKAQTQLCTCLPAQLILLCPKDLFNCLFGLTFEPLDSQIPIWCPLFILPHFPIIFLHMPSVHFKIPNQNILSAVAFNSYDSVSITLNILQIVFSTIVELSQFSLISEFFAIFLKVNKAVIET